MNEKSSKKLGIWQLTIGAIVGIIGIIWFIQDMTLTASKVDIVLEGLVPILTGVGFVITALPNLKK